MPAIWVDGKTCPNVPVTPPLKYFAGQNFLPENPVAWYAGVMVNRLFKFKPDYKRQFAERTALLGVSLPGEPSERGK